MNDFSKEISEGNLFLVPLHFHPEYKEQCMLILNKEWPRSETLRYRSLDSSCDNLPTSLVLVETKDERAKVVGHSRLNIIPKDLETVWIESVIIHHDLRGKGYGRVLMELTEEYAFSLGYKYATLSTHGEEKFYEKLGYAFSQPVCVYGGPVSRLFLPKTYMPIVNGTVKELNIEDNNFNNSVETNCVPLSASSRCIQLPSHSMLESQHSSSLPLVENILIVNNIPISSPIPQYSSNLSKNNVKSNIPLAPPLATSNIPLAPPLPQFSTSIHKEKLKKLEIQRIDGINKKLYMKKAISYGTKYSQI